MVGIFMATVLLVASETAGVVTQQHESAKKENPKSLPTLRGLESWATIFAPSSRRGSFSLDSPLYTTRLPDKWNYGSNLGLDRHEPGWRGLKLSKTIFGQSLFSFAAELRAKNLNNR